MSDRSDGITFDAGNVNVGDYLERWLADSVRDSVRATTHESYSYLVRKYIIPSLGRVKLKSLTPARVQRFYREKLDSGLSPRTVQYLHTLLHKAFKQAVRWGLVPRNATEAVDAPKPVKKEIESLTLKQVKTFMEAVFEDRFGPLYLLALRRGYAGARYSG